MKVYEENQAKIAASQTVVANTSTQTPIIAN
jgi:hypothetical protein